MMSLILTKCFPYKGLVKKSATMSSDTQCDTLITPQSIRSLT
jgi:hypothetical protein